MGEKDGEGVNITSIGEQKLILCFFGHKIDHNKKHEVTF